MLALTQLEAQRVGQHDGALIRTGFPHGSVAYA